MEEKMGRLKGRPSMKSGKRTKKIDARFTEEEFAVIIALESSLGISKTEIVRRRVLNRSAQLVVNAQAMVSELDGIGAELGRSGNNINQLARYANTLNKRGLLSAQIIERFDVLLEKHNEIQVKLEVTLRKILRQMSH